MQSKILALIASLATLTMPALAGESRFIKLDKDCNKLSNKSKKWEAIYDSKTELYWEIKKDDDSPRHYDKRYFWGGDNIPEYKGIPKTYGNWMPLIEYINSNKLCGFDNWRVPTIEELASLASGSKKQGGKYWETNDNNWGRVYLDPNYFPHILKMDAPFFWSNKFYEHGAYGFGYQFGGDAGVLIDHMGSRVMLVRSKSQL
jgi:hypothetical protein